MMLVSKCEKHGELEKHYLPDELHGKPINRNDVEVFKNAIILLEGNIHEMTLGFEAYLHGGVKAVAIPCGPYSVEEHEGVGVTTVRAYSSINNTGMAGRTIQEDWDRTLDE